MQDTFLHPCHAGGCPRVGELPTTGDLVADRPLKGGHHGLRCARLVPVISLPFRASVESVAGACGTASLYHALVEPQQRVVSLASLSATALKEAKTWKTPHRNRRWIVFLVLTTAVLQEMR
jgi:hypothetical protein